MQQPRWSLLLECSTVIAGHHAMTTAPIYMWTCMRIWSGHWAPPGRKRVRCLRQCEARPWAPAPSAAVCVASQWGSAPLVIRTPPPKRTTANQALGSYRHTCRCHQHAPQGTRWKGSPVGCCCQRWQHGWRMHSVQPTAQSQLSP
jgi:hypothetical protein